MSKKVMVIIRDLPKSHLGPVSHAVIEQLDIKKTTLTQEEYDEYLPEWFENEAARIIADFRKRLPEFEKATFTRYILESNGAGLFFHRSAE